MFDTFAKILGRREHYGCSGENAHIVARAQYKSPGSLGAGFPMKTTTIQFRHGRDDEGEAVQIEVCIEKRFDSGRRSSEFASVAFSPEVWAQIVEFVKENRTVEV